MRTTPFTATDALRAATKSSVETAAEERAHVDVKKALESTDCIICEGMRLKCWGPNLTHAMFNADRQIVIFLYAPLQEIQKRLTERSNGTLSKDIIRGQRESAHSAKKWQTAGCDVVAIDTTKQTADQIADFIINKINS